MIYTEKTKKALNIAYKAHMGQVDRAGMPYIFHPYHLAEQMETEDECVVALLHDVVEDTSVTFDELESIFSDDVIRTLKLLTRDKSVPYMDYVKKVSTNQIARKVKLADLRHNSDLTRLDKVTEKDQNRVKKYADAIRLLSGK